MLIASGFREELTLQLSLDTALVVMDSSVAGQSHLRDFSKYVDEINRQLYESLLKINVRWITASVQNSDTY
ncbi:MAG: hypothetical protein ACFBSF_21185 [Leptolyngbyaceae cyanobacterium]